MDQLDVTVIMVTYDRPRLLRRALESVARQTMPFDRFEVVLVNDAGPDPTRVVDEFREGLGIRLVNHPYNTGIAGALQTGVSEARGRYVCFLADDDLYYPRHVEALYERAEELGGRTVVYSDAVEVQEDEQGTDLTRQMYQVTGTFNDRQLWVQNNIPGICLIVPRFMFEEVGTFDNTFDALEDWEMWLRLSKAFPFARLLEVTCEYRMRANAPGNNTTRLRPRHFRSLERLYDKHPTSDPDISALRARNLEASRRLLDEHGFELSVLIAADEDMSSLQRTLESIVTTLGEHGSYEVLIHVPETDASRALRDALDGDVRVLYGDVPTSRAWSVLERNAAGRDLVRVEAGGALDLSARTRSPVFG